MNKQPNPHRRFAIRTIVVACAGLERGNEVAVVVSAMSGATNQLVKWVNEIAPLHDARETHAKEFIRLMTERDVFKSGIENIDDLITDIEQALPRA